MTADAQSISPNQRLLITIVLMAATLMVVLDTTIANVALPHMQTALSASPDNVTWVLTSYMLANAVALPLTGYFSNRLGRRTMLTLAIMGFTASSAVCGVATSLPVMVLARVAQGFFGASLVPLSQAVMYDINPPEKIVQAMTIWGLVIMVGPISGPVLGGWITDNFDWRWVFFINLPIGLAAGAGSWLLLPRVKPSGVKFDMFGFMLLAVALSSMQIMLDRGVEQDWFNSIEIWCELAIMIASLWMFVVHTVTARETVLPRALFKDRNFVIAVCVSTVMGGIMSASSALLPPMLQRLMGYSVYDAGLLTAPRGAAVMAGMLVAGRITKYIDTRALIMCGMVLLAYSLSMMSGFSLAIDRAPIIVSSLWQGAALGLVVMPMNLMALSTLPPNVRTEAASLYNLSRTLGGSIAISISTTLLSNNTQISHSDLAAHISQTRIPILNSGMAEQFGFRGTDALQLMNNEVTRQAVMVAYIDNYWLMMWAAIAVVPLVILIRPKKSAKPDVGVVDAH